MGKMYQKTGDDSKIVHFRACIILTIMQGFFVDICISLYLLFDEPGEIKKNFFYIFVILASLLVFNFYYFSKRKEKIFKRLERNEVSRNKLIKTIVIGTLVVLFVLMLIMGDVIRARNGF